MTLSEHAEKIRAAIQAAETDGYSIECDVYHLPDGDVHSVDLEIYKYSVNGLGQRYVAQYATLHTDER